MDQSRIETANTAPTSAGCPRTRMPSTRARATPTTRARKRSGSQRASPPLDDRLALPPDEHDDERERDERDGGHRGPAPHPCGQVLGREQPEQDVEDDHRRVDGLLHDQVADDVGEADRRSPREQPGAHHLAHPDGQEVDRHVGDAHHHPERGEGHARQRPELELPAPGAEDLQQQTEADGGDEPAGVEVGEGVAQLIVIDVAKREDEKRPAHRQAQQQLPDPTHARAGLLAPAPGSDQATAVIAARRHAR